MTKLSRTQQDLLDAMKAGVVVHSMRGNSRNSAYFFSNDTRRPCTAAAFALRDKGLARIDGEWNSARLVLIDNPAT